MAEFSLILRVLEQGSELVKRKLKACEMNTGSIIMIIRGNGQKSII